LCTSLNRDKKTAGVFVRFRAPLHPRHDSVSSVVLGLDEAAESAP
jgi:hypothetical protein